MREERTGGDGGGGERWASPAGDEAAVEVQFLRKEESEYSEGREVCGCPL